MELQNRKEHTECICYATEDNARFRLLALAKGESVPEDSSTFGTLIYIMEGSLEVEITGTDGATQSEKVPAGHMVFFSGYKKNSLLAAERIRAIECVLPQQISLCHKYSLSDLQRDYKEISNKFPPPVNIRNSQQMNILDHSSLIWKKISGSD